MPVRAAIALDTKDFFPLVKGFRRNLVRRVRDGTKLAAADFVREFKSSHLRHRSRRSLGKVTGALERSLVYEVKAPFGRGFGRVDLVIFFRGARSQFLARVHMEGRTIRPKNKEYLHFRLRNGQWVKTKGPIRLRARFSLQREFETKFVPRLTRRQVRIVNAAVTTFNRGLRTT